MSRSELLAIAAVLISATTYALPTPALGGPHASGTLIVHSDPGVTYTPDSDAYCATPPLALCETASRQSPPLTTSVVHVVAAFSPASTPSLSGVTFGVSYNPAEVLVEDYGVCGDFSLPTSSWPDPDEGIAVTWAAPQTSFLVLVGWFAVYAYQDAEDLYLGPHPAQGGFFSDGSSPAVLDEIADYGQLGFGQGGYLPCPPLVPEEDPTDDGSDEGSDEGPDLPDSSDGDEPTDASFLMEALTAWFEDDAMVYDPLNEVPVEPGSAEFLASAVRLELESVGCQLVAKKVPWLSLGQTERMDRWREPVEVPDLARYFSLTFSDVAAATAADQVLSASDHYRGVWQDRSSEVMSSGTAVPNDSLLYEGRGQWYIDNTDNLMADLRLSTPWPYKIPLFGERFVIGQADVGIVAEHEDLRLLPLTALERDTISRNPEYDYCGTHGTEMAGVAAAKTDNQVGIAAPCSDCEILDLEWCANRFLCPSATCRTIALEAAGLEYALDHIGMDVFLYEGGSGGYASIDRIDSFFAAYKRGVLPIAPAGQNQSRSATWQGNPANLPFVLGVGGFTQDDFFFGTDGCNYGANSHSNPGPGFNVAGPACFRAMTTAIPGPDTYGETTLRNSGATAAVAGSAALLQMIQYNERYGWGDFGADDYLGMMMNCVRPYAGGDAPQDLYGCGACTREDFGTGIVDVSQLIRLGFGFHSLDEFHVETLRYGDTGASFDSLDVLLPGLADSTLYEVWRLSKSFQIPETRDEDLPRYIAWPNHVGGNLGALPTTTPLFYQSMDPLDVFDRDGRMQHFAEAEVTSCELTRTDPSGMVTLSGYTVKKLSPEGETWLFDPEEMVMSFTYYSKPLQPAGAGSPHAMEGRLAVLGNPSGRGSVQFRWHRPLGESHRLEVFDSSGRLVWEGRAGTGTDIVEWPALDSKGRRIPSGMYWARLRDDGMTLGEAKVVTLQ